MPELPEVEIVVRRLKPLLRNQTIRGVAIRRTRVIAPTSEREMIQKLGGAIFENVARRGKYLVFTLAGTKRQGTFQLLGHLGMTGRIYLSPKETPLPKHAAVVLDLGEHNFIYEDTRYFGRLTLDLSALSKLGPEPLSREFSVEYFTKALQQSSQPIKVKLLDQSVIAGVGNIYASESLFRAKISPRLPAKKLTPEQIKHLHHAIRKTLENAIRSGDSARRRNAGNVFYHGTDNNAEKFYPRRFAVYDRRGKACPCCATEIERFVQAARSTFYCPQCQK